MTISFLLQMAAAVGCALVGGIFYAFSTFVMAALGRIPAPQGIAAMQSINVAVINPLFMIAFFGTGLVCLAAAVAAIWRWHEVGSVLVLAGAAIYIAGVIVETMLFNVPLNNALAAMAPASPEGERLWARYLVEWTGWNHVRTAAGLLAAVLFVIALYVQARDAA